MVGGQSAYGPIPYLVAQTLVPYTEKSVHIPSPWGGEWWGGRMLREQGSNPQTLGTNSLPCGALAMVWGQKA